MQMLLMSLQYLWDYHPRKKNINFCALLLTLPRVSSLWCCNWTNLLIITTLLLTPAWVYTNLNLFCFRKFVNNSFSSERFKKLIWLWFPTLRTCRWEWRTQHRYQTGCVRHISTDEHQSYFSHKLPGLSASANNHQHVIVFNTWVQTLETGNDHRKPNYSIDMIITNQFFNTIDKYHKSFKIIGYSINQGFISTETLKFSSFSFWKNFNLDWNQNFSC